MDIRATLPLSARHWVCTYIHKNDECAVSNRSQSSTSSFSFSCMYIIAIVALCLHAFLFLTILQADAVWNCWWEGIIIIWSFGGVVERGL